MHAAFSVYLRGELSFAPMAEVLPRKILDLGRVNILAIQAAKQFPEAEVHAIDISPLPNRILPSNIHFQLADLTQELNFETETFTIVHARLVMCHVSNGKDVIERAARLVRPGGLLLIEDLDISNLVSTGGPAVKRFISTLIQLATARGGDMEIGRKLEGIITSLGVFEDINVTKITVPLSGTGSDSAKNELGLALKKSFASLDLGKHGQWMTASVLQQYREEIGYSG
ncbi:S-adenosyl-L-methionine-dependent methyltransferase, partial [Mycena leptocephala]